jgi:2-oxoglutarate ferredoxin oxidoreductase subunit delta
MATESAIEGKPPAEKKRKGPLGRPILNIERCKGCGFCVEFCPAGVLRMSRDFNKKGYHYPEIVNAEACTACDLCGMYCPDFAIYSVRFAAKKSKKE